MYLKENGDEFLHLRLSTGLGFLHGTSSNDDQFSLLVWLLLSLLAFFSYLKALNFSRACNQPITVN